jgi:hypothetical protein
MAQRTTTATQRVDMLLVQAERFHAAGQDEEARARARQVIAYAELERTRCGESVCEELEERELLAEELMARLGRQVRDRGGHLFIHPDDAEVPETWA